MQVEISGSTGQACQVDFACVDCTTDPTRQAEVRGLSLVQGDNILLA